MSQRLISDSTREIFLVPYKIDEKGTIYIQPMLKSEVGKERMKRLVDMGIFSKDVLNISTEDKILVTGSKIKIEVKNNE